MKCLSLYALGLAIALPALLVSALRAEPAGLRWRPAPARVTKSFLITEFGYNFRLTQNHSANSGGNRNFHFVWELGWMRNLSSQWALGPTAYLSMDDDASRLAPRLRLRRWINDQTAVDASAGVVIQNFSTYHDRPFGPVLTLSAERCGFAAAVVTLEVIPYDVYSESAGGFRKVAAVWPETTLYGGVRLTSYPGGIAAVLAPLAVLVHFMLTYES